MAWREPVVARRIALVAFFGIALCAPCLAQGQTNIPQAPDTPDTESESEDSQTSEMPGAELRDSKPDSGILIQKESKDPRTGKMQSQKQVREPETNIIPSIRLSERYDSNVFFVQGGNLEDYVTTVMPQLRVVHKRSLVEATVGGGVTAEAYVKNPGLNYVAANGSLDLNLDGAMNELIRGLGLRISDTFYYTPQPPLFAAPIGGGQVPEAFVRGIQAMRANSRTNAGSVEASYSLSRDLDFLSKYKDQRIRFGNAFATPTGIQGFNATFIDTTFQTVTSGPVYRISPLDTISLSHVYQKGTFDFGSQTTDFSTQGAIAGWTRSLTPSLTASVQGGVAVLSISNEVQPLAGAALEWQRRDTDIRVSYTRVIVPSFLVVATPLLSQVVSVTTSHRLTQALSLSLMANYALNESIPDRSLLKFESYSVTPSINYMIGRDITASLSYTHSQFSQNFSSQEFRFDRNIVMLSLFAEWK
jgi:hypothetical protein